jgi:aspartyl-tRNA(Asn)/glutamyl-tRNA(Gln) amidotransferase subunit C
MLRATLPGKRGSLLISRTIVENVAALAHLELSEAELDRMTAELGAILDHIAVLSTVQTDHIAPTAQVLDLRNVMRDDVVTPCLPTEAVLANAPDREDDSFRVRAVLE